MSTPKPTAVTKPVSTAARKGGRLTQGKAIERQQLIVRLHDVDHLTFAQIAKQVGLGEKETREAFHRYVREVAPLMNSLSGHDTVAARLRLLEEIMQSLRRLAKVADNDSARVGALRELVRTIVTDIEIRRDVGLIPSAADGLELEHELAWMGEEIGKLLVKVGAGPEALTELEQILAGQAVEKAP